ncbi:hypothetical protein N9B73_08215 [Verrucomicrobiales bacterium]|nr:hypothetical protein [Verrucomicrobiales bacterium]
MTRRVRNSQGGTLSIWIKDSKFHASFTDAKGKEMACEPVSVPDFEKSSITIRFGGTPDTPRKITRVVVKRL